MEKELRLLLGDSSIDVLTTIIDYYGFAVDAPGMADRPSAGPQQRVRHVENAVKAAVGDPRFLPHLTLHETEAWVFAAANELSELLTGADGALRAEADGAGGPELVNESPDTAPSKRLLRHYPTYNKVMDGPPAIVALGMPALRASCPHLDAWLVELEKGVVGDAG